MMSGKLPPLNLTPALERSFEHEHLTFRYNSFLPIQYCRNLEMLFFRLVPFVRPVLDQN